MSAWERIETAEQEKLEEHRAERIKLLDKVVTAARSLLLWSAQRAFLEDALRELDAHDGKERARQAARVKNGDMCPKCYGSGTRTPVPSIFNGPCEMCNGSGRVRECLNCKYPPPDAFGHVIGHVYMGPGQPWKKCGACKGMALVPHTPDVKEASR